MKKSFLFIVIIFFNILLFGSVVHAQANYSKYRDNNDRLSRIKKGCKSNIKRNLQKCQALQQDLVRDIGVMSCGQLVTSFGINEGRVELCQDAIDEFKPGGPPKTSSGTDSTGGGGDSGSGAGSPSPSSSASTTPGGSTPDEPKPSQWGGNEVGANLKTTKPDKITVGTDEGNIDISKDDEQTIIGNILNVVYSIAATIAVIVIIICGIMITTADGDAQKVATARRGIIYAVVGLLIIGTAFIITGVIQGIAANAP